MHPRDARFPASQNERVRERVREHLRERMRERQMRYYRGIRRTVAFTPPLPLARRFCHVGQASVAGGRARSRSLSQGDRNQGAVPFWVPQKWESASLRTHFRLPGIGRNREEISAVCMARRRTMIRHAPTHPAISIAPASPNPPGSSHFFQGGTTAADLLAPRMPAVGS